MLISVMWGSAARAQSALSPAAPVLHAGQSLQFSGMANGAPFTNGYWWMNGPGNAGWLEQNGTYHAPNDPPSGPVTVGYYEYSGQNTYTTVTVVNPVPQPDGTTAASINSLSTSFLIHGAGFEPGITVSYNGQQLPTTYYGANVRVQLNLSGPVSGPLVFTLTNPAPGSSSATFTIPSGFATSGITPAAAVLHAGSATQFAVEANGTTPTSGYWFVNGSGNVGSISSTGVYTPSATAPANSVVTIGYYLNGNTITTTATLVNPLPQVSGLNVSTINRLSTPLVITGTGFLPTSTVLVQGVPVPTTYISPQQLGATVSLSAATSSAVAVSVVNPDPGGSSTSVQVPTSFSTTGVTPTGISIHAGTSQQYTITINGQTPTDGYWYLNGAGPVGTLSASGLYTAPATPGTATTYTVGFYRNGQNYETTGTITNPIPAPTGTSTQTVTQLSTQMWIFGTGFLPTSVVSVGGQAMPTTWITSNVLNTTITLPNAINGTIPVTVTNPNPGGSTGTVNITGLFPGITSASPSTLQSGWVTVQATGSGFTNSTVMLLDGRPMKTTFNSATSLTGVGYLPSWRNETSAVVGTAPSSGVPQNSSVTVPVTNPTVSYDTASRFAMQAALGPRPDVVDHIQQVGLQGFLTEQLNQPGVTYNPAVLPRFNFMQGAVFGNSLLRQRVSMALTSFVVNQANSQEYQSYAPWEMTLESDVFGNYRQLMTDMISNALLADLLTLPGNYANMSSSTHPNQNFSREILQLFTLGTSALNDDGSTKTDSNGLIVPNYDQNTILDMSRALTGWNFGPVLNPAFTAYQIDFSQPLAPFDQYHDHGAKTLFGTVNLPAGQDIVTDRTQALDAVFAQPSLPPFVVTRLIEQLVESNPSPAYVNRVVQVFKNNGKGVRGDMTAVIQAILLDTEARHGDTLPVTATEGVLQDPLLWQLTVLNALQQTTWDGQAIYYPGMLGEDWWHPNSVFGFYPATYNIPGLTLNGPQFSLLNNLTLEHRSQLLYGIVSGTVSGFGVGYEANSWLFQAFTNVPDLVDGLNHLVYHGQMSTATQNAILSYCNGISDPNQAFVDAIFLALNSDAYNIEH